MEYVTSLLYMVLFCPPKMHSGLLTVAAADNIDYNPSAATAKILLEISLLQQPSHEFKGSNFYIQ